MSHVDRILDQWAAERPDLDVRAMGPLGRLKRLMQHLQRKMDATFARHGLNLSSFDVLATLRRSGKPYRLSPGELLDQTMVTSGTMTNRIDQLVKAQLVERVANPDDGRSVLIALTPAGKRLIDRALTEHTKTQTELCTGLSDKDLVALDRLLAKWLRQFE